MTRDEAMRPFAMLSANWNFLNFNEETTFELWFSILEPYMAAEVVQGVKNAVADLDHTPVVAEILTYVRNVREGNRRKEAEAEAQRQESEAVQCRKCNDYGFVNIIYPKGYEAVRPCSCEKARKTFGEAILKETASDLPDWKVEMLFGVNEIPSRFRLVRVSRRPVPTGETYKDKDGNTLPRMKYGFVPYQPKRGKGKEEIFWQYQKK